MRRRTLLGLALTLAVVLALGVLGFVAAQPTVTLSLDGRERQVRTSGGTVGELLAGEGIAVDRARDLVTPATDAQVRDGQTIVVRFGRPVRLTVDGSTRTVWTTARSVDEALRVVGVRDSGAVVSASRSRRIGRDGIALEVRTPHRLVVRADGTKHRLTTTAATVRAALTEAGVDLRPRDKVSADVLALPSAEKVVTVTRIDHKRVKTRTKIDFGTQRRTSNDLYTGSTRVLRAGRSGLRVHVFRVTLHDGKRHHRNLVDKRVTRRPVSQVLLVGTRPAPQNTPTSDGLNWAALANCESGGNPSVVNPAGPYYGLYQFMASTWASVGGSGLPSQASASEQTYRAQILYRRSGAGQWPVCGRLLFS